MGLSSSLHKPNRHDLCDWSSMLKNRVAALIKQDAPMGREETKRWMDELAAFKADLS